MGTDPGTFRLSPLMTREVEELRENLILSSITASEP
jgi:hypothetical protein